MRTDSSTRANASVGFHDRLEAGRRLARELEPLRHEDLVILGLPRGGVPVAFEVAQALGAPLDVIVVRKLGVPFRPELAMGAIGEGGVRILNRELIHDIRINEADLVEVERREREELERQVRLFRGDRTRVSLQSRTAVVVDDGIATGSTARAACQVARAHGAARVILAIPVAARSSLAELAGIADQVVCVETPEHFMAVGQWYDDFRQVSDSEVSDLLRRAAISMKTERANQSRAAPTAGRDADVEVPTGRFRLAGHLCVPGSMNGLVAFAHGSGSSRHSPRNQLVARALNEAGFGTLLIDLLTPGEELDRSQVFDIELLANRLVDVTRWLRTQPEAATTPIGYFGASTGAGAALVAAARSDVHISAIVSRGGRPDLAGPVLGEVRSPTLLIVGGNDEAVLDLNLQAQAQLRCEHKIVVVPGASHLFVEPGTLAQVAALARQWFAQHLTGSED